MDKTKLPPLPDGFQLVEPEQPAKTDMPPLPEGFQMLEPEGQTTGPQLATEPLRPYDSGDEIVSSLTFGLSDELNAGLMAPIRTAIGKIKGQDIDLGQAYDAILEETRAAQDKYRSENPGKSIASNVAGGALIGGGVAPKVIATGAGKVTNALRSTGAGAALGGATGFGESEGGVENRLKDAAEGAVGGAVIGAAVPALGRAAGKVVQAFRNRAATKMAPSAEALKKQATDFYNASEKAGVIVKQEALQRFVPELQKQMAGLGIDNELHRPAVRAIERIAEDANRGNATFKHLDILRQIAGDVAGNADKAIAQKGVAIKNALDDFVESLKPSDIVTGDVRVARDMIETGRSLYRRMAKARTIEQLFDLAELRAGQYSQSGLENALRTEFRGLARRIAKGQERGWTKGEIQAIRKVATGGGDIIGNAARLIGKMAVRGPVSGGLNVGVGAALTPAAGIATAGLGEVGKAASRAMTRNAANQASRLVRSGAGSTASTVPQQRAVEALTMGQAMQGPRVKPRVEGDIDMLSRALLRGGY